MKIVTKILALTMVLAAVSCSRKVVVASSHTTLSQDSTVKAIDTSKISAIEQTQQVVDYGDTLNGSLFIPNDTTLVFVDSIESKGVKVSLVVVPTKGGFKARLNAVAKPKSVTNTNTKSTTEAKGKSSEATNNKDLEKNDKNKQVEKKDEFMMWVVLGIIFVSIIVVAGFLIWLWFKTRSND